MVKKRGVSPTQRSLASLRKRGFLCAIVERWNPHAHIRQDLFGFADLLVVSESGGIVAVQTTTSANMAARRTKILGLDAPLAWLRAGGRIVLHGWVKRGTRWELREEEITEECFVVPSPPT